MSDFWRIFKQTAYFRISWNIQDAFINYFIMRKKTKERQSIIRNADEIIEKINNNEFNKYRVKK